MRTATLVRRSLTYYWRTNLLVVLGVATAVAVLAGALVVGDSVRASLRDLVLNRIGRTDAVVSAPNFFPEQLSTALAQDQRFSTCPLIAFEGLVMHDASGRRASGVQVYGVDERFWRFHGVAAPQLPAMSTALAEDLGAKPGDAVLLRVQKPSAIPLESLHGRKEDLGRTLRFTAHEPLATSALGDFSLRPQQGPVRAIFVPLRRLERDLGETGKVNTILIAGEPAAAPIEKLLHERYTLEDLGLTLRVLDATRGVSLESAAAILSDSIAAAAMDTARKLGVRTEPILTYLANSIRVGSREIPYSLVTADDDFFKDAKSGLVLNDWAARELSAHTGDSVTLEYYTWTGDGQLHNASAQFPLAGVLPITGPAGDRDFAPDYPGITQTASLHDWDPPFPIDLKRVRPSDEEYWKKYRTTPKAFLPLAAGQKLWGSRFGKLTSIRLHGAGDNFANQLRAAIDPMAAGFAVYPVRAQALAASEGATDFGEYFVYFSFFLMAAALLLAALFFRLSIEQRLREIGMLRAMGFRDAAVRNVFLLEGGVLALAGSALGLAGAAGYGALVMFGLRTSWSGAVGTRLLSLRITLGAFHRSRRRLQRRSPLHLVDTARAAPHYAAWVAFRTTAAIENAGMGGARMCRGWHRIAGFDAMDRRSGRVLWRRRSASDRGVVRRARLVGETRIGGASGHSGARVPERGLAARPQHSVHGAHRVRHVPHHRRGCIPPRGAAGARSEIGYGRFRADGRIAAAADSRSKLASGQGSAEPDGPCAERRALYRVPAASRGRYELSQPVPAAQPAHPRSSGRFSVAGPILVPGVTRPIA